MADDASSGETTQVVVVLDLEGALPDAEVLAPLPPIRHHRAIVRLSDYGAPAVVRDGAERSPIDWEGVGEAVTRMIEDVRRAAEQRSHRTEYVVVGRAPLPVFVHAGMTLSAWAQPLTLLNRRKDGGWDILPTAASASGTFFDKITLLPQTPPSEASGRVAVFISAGATVNHDQLHDFVRQLGDRVAGIVEIVPATMRPLTAENSGAAAQQLADLFAQIAAAFPRRTGVALFVAGPATLGCLVGRAINPRVFDDVAVANLNAGTHYELALVLPLRDPQVITPLPGPEAADGRARTLDEFRASIEDLQRDMVDADFPSWLDAATRENVLRELRRLEIDSSLGAEFSLSVLRHQLLVGDSLLEALRNLRADMRGTVASLLTLHELYHTVQGIQTTNFREIGRAGTALEQVDFFADALSVELLVRRSLRQVPGSSVRDVSVTLIEAVLSGMRAFDGATAGTRIQRLPERRLRRYLIWHLQRQRATTTTSLDQVAALFRDRLVVELAPLRGFLDNRFDKIASEALPNTELVIALGPKIARFHRRPGFEPGGLLDAVKAFDFNVVQGAMDVVIHETRDFVAWIT